MRYLEWKAAHAAAVALARSTHHDVALRKVKEFGKVGYNIKLASLNDSDYARAEIVKPGDPV